MTEISVVVATYDRPDALRAVLTSLTAQTYEPFSVTVADDGSTDATKRVIEELGGSTATAFRHVWQPDEGPRKSTVLNKAIIETPADYLIFIDGDCLVRPDFVRSHAKLAESGRFVRGSRIMIGESLTTEILGGRVAAHEWSAGRWLAHRLRGRIDRASPLFRLPLGPTRLLRGRKWKGVKGCNVAAWRDDLLAIGGFEEEIAGPGPEDVDLALRLIRYGVRRKEGRYAVPVLHLWHPERSADPENERVFEERLRSRGFRATRGLEPQA
ncbi:MAG: glycosyltransferase family 2 protein [Gemmatimonadota bacterium]|nr:glycosyltransferase family 2 protein [Gemmatimonadota bacterium]